MCSSAPTVASINNQAASAVPPPNSPTAHYSAGQRAELQSIQAQAQAPDASVSKIQALVASVTAGATPTVVPAIPLPRSGALFFDRPA